MASIKNKLGVNNSYYLKISTQIVGNALHNIIGEVNDAQSILKVNKDDPNAALAALLGLTRVKSALEEAWKATLIMDSFDMESEFKSNRYDVNRKTLKGMCDQLDVSTSSERVVLIDSSIVSPMVNSINQSSRVLRDSPKAPPIHPDTPPTPPDDTPWGCICGIIVFIIILIMSTCN